MSHQEDTTREQDDDNGWQRLFQNTQAGAPQGQHGAIEVYPFIDLATNHDISPIDEPIAYHNYLSISGQTLDSYLSTQLSAGTSINSGCIGPSSGSHTEYSFSSANEPSNASFTPSFSYAHSTWPDTQSDVSCMPAWNQLATAPFQAGEGLTVPMLRRNVSISSTSPPRKQTDKRKASVCDDRESDSKRPVLTSPSHLVGATPEQEEKLQASLVDWQTRDRLPAEKELRAVATLTGLSFFKVALWYGDRLRLSSNSGAPSPISASGTNAEILRDVAKYIEDASQKQCSTAHSRKGAGGKYSCTWQCGYSTNHRDAWVRHEEKRQPQKFWHCIRCRAMRRAGERMEPFIAHRRDKFLKHSQTLHPSEDADELREGSKVPYDAPFVRSCTFILRSTGMLCNHVSTNWNERIDHYLQHFEETVSEESSDDPSNNDSDDDEDDTPDNGRYRNQRSPNSHPRAFSTNAKSSSSSHLGTSPVNYNQGQQRYSHTCGGLAMNSCNNTNPETGSGSSDGVTCRTGSISKKEAPCSHYGRKGASEGEPAAHWLIDMTNYSTVEAKSHLRYIALKYSAPQGTPQRCLESLRNQICPSLPLFKDLPAVFQKVLRLAEEMDFQYLWIDSLCGLKTGMGGIDRVYSQANLILAVGHPSQRCDQIWHFICDYSHLDMIQSWAKQSVSFHHLKQLGHGAYGVVDKIQLQPTKETFARKIVFRTNTKQTQCVREINIMRKLSHPHIATFVAAYYDRSAFNILMSPVADCDLRLFLSCPDRFTDTSMHISRWFLSLAGALAYMHGMRCRHKDIKPANILVSGNKVLLTDFGTSMDFSTSRSTSAGSAIMTPKYCAPEVARNSERGRSADIFSLGCVFVEMITVALRKPLEDLYTWLGMDQESSSSHGTYQHHLREVSLWLKSLNPLSLDDNQAAVLRTTHSMLDSNPRARPTAFEVAKALSTGDALGIDPSTNCPCCFRLAAGKSIEKQHDIHSSNYTISKNLHMPSNPRQDTITAFFSIHLWDKFGKVNTYVTAIVQLHVTFQSEEGKVERYCPFLHSIDLFTWIIRILWNCTRTDIKSTSCASRHFGATTTEVVRYFVDFDCLSALDGREANRALDQACCSRSQGHRKIYGTCRKTKHVRDMNLKALLCHDMHV